MIAGQSPSDLRCSGVAGVALQPRKPAREAVQGPRGQALRDLEEAASRWAALHDPVAAGITVVATVETITSSGCLHQQRRMWRFTREDLSRST